MSTREELVDKLHDLNDKGQRIIRKVKNRDFTEAERRQLGAICDEFTDVEAELMINFPEAVYDRSFLDNLPSRGRQADPQNPEPQNRMGRGGRESGLQVPRGYSQFRSDGEFFQAIKDSCAHGGTLDGRLILDAPTTVSTEGVGADGGFLVPPQWSRDIFSTVIGEGSLVDRCNVVPVTGNTYVQILDTGPPWAASGGILAYWKAEATALTESKMDLKDTTKRLCKLTALVPVTEELLEDAPSLDGYLRRKVASIFDFKINMAILQGVGAGTPSGIMPAACLITVPKETGQDADTVIFENIVNMWARLAPGSENQAVWLMHKDVWPQLLRLTVGVGAAGSPAFLPPDAAAGRPYQSLMGRPIVTTQACETLGEKGDLILADLTQYQIILKTSGMRSEVSAHVYFLWDTLCYKFVIRIDGAPLWPAAIAARSGSATYSPFVTLAERA